jgi:hypothetical protein
VGHLSTFAST